jgi:hypothetical protein
MLFMDESEVEFVKALISRLDLDRKYIWFLKQDLGFMDCSTISTWITNHIDENKIFEVMNGTESKPVIIDDNLAKPVSYIPLTLSKLKVLSEFATFLNESIHGITVEVNG